MNETDYSSGNILTRLFSSISVDKFKESSDVMAAWKETLYSIKSYQKDEVKPVEYGSQLADHSHIVDLKDGTLYVETDHPGRMQLFQLYKRYILNGLKQKIPGIPIKNIVFKLRKPETTTGGLRMPTREEMDRAAQSENAAARAADAATNAAYAASSVLKENSQMRDEGNKNSISSVKNTAAALPPELQDIFASMKASLSD